MIEPQTHGPRIRPVESCHIAELIEIGDSVNLSPWTAQNYLDELKTPAAIMLRLETDDSKTVGFIVGRVIAGASAEAESEAEIYNMAVTENEQGIGRGQMLFDAFAEECRIRKVVSIWLEVRESNETAINFYRKNGFETVQTRSHFYNNPREHALLMRLFLPENET